eukprot:scaffold15242_cov138-Isochrysis_galbana.AAC.2
MATYSKAPTRRIAGCAEVRGTRGTLTLGFPCEMRACSCKGVRRTGMQQLEGRPPHTSNPAPD